jgi:hypothetical protein
MYREKEGVLSDLSPDASRNCRRSVGFIVGGSCGVSLGSHLGRGHLASLAWFPLLLKLSLLHGVSCGPPFGWLTLTAVLAGKGSDRPNSPATTTSAHLLSGGFSPGQLVEGLEVEEGLMTMYEGFSSRSMKPLVKGSDSSACAGPWCCAWPVPLRFPCTGICGQLATWMSHLHRWKTPP